MINFDEYKLKKQQMNEQLLKILADDSDDGTVYILQMRNRETNRVLDCGVFRHYSAMKETIECNIEFEQHANDDNYCAADFKWFDVDKYIMSDGEYTRKMAVGIAFDYSLIYCLPEDGVMKYPASLEQELEAPYETGDIIKIKVAPLSEDYYAIYIYDEKQKENKHIQMMFKEEPEFCKIYWLETTKKVIEGPNKRINDMSKRIKEMNGDFSKALQSCGIKMEIQPF